MDYKILTQDDLLELLASKLNACWEAVLLLVKVGLGLFDE